MTEKRRVLAPHIFPVNPAAPQTEGPLYYLSWPGWELFIRRRLGFAPAPDSPQPILLPDATDAETDFKTIDQLNTMAAQMGANFFTLAPESPESLPNILGNIRAYHAPKSPAPLLDDRACLALWAISEYHRQESEKLFAQAQRQEKKMWAALKGEEFHDVQPNDLPPTNTEPDSRSLYIWQAWRRLAEGAIGAEDVIVATALELEQD